MHWFTKRPPCWFVSFILPSSTIQVRWWTGLIRDVILMLRNTKYLYLYFSESRATTRKRVCAIGLGWHTKTLWCSLSLFIFSHICGKILMIMRTLPRIRSRRKMVRSWVIARASMGNWVVWGKINIKLMNSPSLLLGLLSWKPWKPQTLFISNPSNFHILWSYRNQVQPLHCLHL